MAVSTLRTGLAALVLAGGCLAAPAPTVAVAEAAVAEAAVAEAAVAEAAVAEVAAAAAPSPNANQTTLGAVKAFDSCDWYMTFTPPPPITSGVEADIRVLVQQGVLRQ